MMHSNAILNEAIIKELQILLLISQGLESLHIACGLKVENPQDKKIGCLIDMLSQKLKELVALAHMGEHKVNIVRFESSIKVLSQEIARYFLTKDKEFA